MGNTPASAPSRWKDGGQRDTPHASARETPGQRDTPDAISWERHLLSGHTPIPVSP